MQKSVSYEWLYLPPPRADTPAQVTSITIPLGNLTNSIANLEDWNIADRGLYLLPAQTNWQYNPRPARKSAPGGTLGRKKMMLLNFLAN